MKVHSMMALQGRLSSISTGWVCFSTFCFRYDPLRKYPEGSRGEELATATTATPFPQLPSTVPSARVTGRAQNKNPNKKRTISTRSSDKEDIGMTLEGSSSSGLLVGPINPPVKRPRTSTIIACCSKVTASLQTAATVTGQNSRSISATTDDDMAIESAITSAAGNMTVDPTPDTPTSHPPSPPQAGTDDAPSDAGTEPSPRSSDLDPNVNPTAPDFFTKGKHNIYSYFNKFGDRGFKALLKNYITFKLTDLSDTQGFLPTDHRPKAIVWWSSRARPGRIPPYGTLSSFRNSVVEWWIFIQPIWQRRKIECGKTLRDEGDFDLLYQSGINGLLNIVVLIYWWASILEEIYLGSFPTHRVLSEGLSFS